MRRPDRGPGDDERDDSPSVFVPALHNYVKASNLPALSRNPRLDVLRCVDPVCRGDSLLEIATRCEDDVQAGRLLACRHNMASTERLARRIFADADADADADPRDGWREACQAGAQASASLLAGGISLPRSRWLRQWLDLGSPSHDIQAAR
jgi:hypothetical protein